jgi:hypothetical protein
MRMSASYRAICPIRAGCRQVTISLRRTALVALVLWIPIVASAEELRVRQYRLDSLWEMSCEILPDYSLLDKEALTVFANLVGVVAYQERSVIICDRISEQLMRFESDGTVAWSVGQIGSGPEDHQGPCEPLLIGSRSLAVVDYASPSKMLFYDVAGGFERSIVLMSFPQYHRIEYSDRGFFGLATKLARVRDGYFMEVHLARLDLDGNLVASRLIREVEMKRLRGHERMPADVWWALPRIVVNDHGNVYLQPDSRVARFVVYGRDLQQIAEIGTRWRGRRRGNEELQSELERYANRVEPFAHDPAGEHVFARANGDLWIQLSGRTHDQVEFEVLDFRGRVRERVVISGMPSATGEFQIVDDTMLWAQTEDAVDREQICLGLYRLTDRAVD